MSVLVISAREVEQTVSMEVAVRAVESAFAAYARGETSMPAKVYLDLPDVGGDFRAMPARAGNYAGLKWVNCHPLNPAEHNLPTVLATYILNDSRTAQPLAILDGTLITALRTGAAAGVASKYLAPRDPKTLGIIGCGAQAPHFVAAHRVVFPSIHVRCYDRDASASERLASALGGEAVNLDGAAGCDIVCTGTPSREPFLGPDLLAKNAHINAMGADAEGKQELTAEVLHKSRVIIDDEAQACHSGEVNVPLHTGAYSKEMLSGTLGEVVAGLKPGREGATGWTVFDSTGLAIQDLFLAIECYRAAQASGVGQSVDLSANS